MFKKLKKKIASVRKKQSKQIIVKILIDGREISKIYFDYRPIKLKGCEINENR